MTSRATKTSAASTLNTAIWTTRLLLRAGRAAGCGSRVVAAMASASSGVILRVSGRDDLRVFNSEEAATAWLVEGMRGGSG